MRFAPIRLRSCYTGDAQGRDEGSLPPPPLHGHPTAGVASSPAPSGPLAKAAPSARSRPPRRRLHQHRPTAIVPAGARANSRAHRSEARSSEVSTVSVTILRALGTLAPKDFGPAAAPGSSPAVRHPLAHPERVAPIRLPNRATPRDLRGEPSPLSYSPLSGLRFTPLQGHDCSLISYPPLRGRLSSFPFERLPRARSSTWTPTACRCSEPKPFRFLRELRGKSRDFWGWAQGQRN